MKLSSGKTKKKKGCVTRLLLWVLGIFAAIIILAVAFGSDTELTGIKAEWTADEYNINDTVELTISPVPKSADIEKLALSDNSIASLEYKDGKAIVTFTAEGSEKLYFIANKDIESAPQLINVIDKKAEAERIAAEQAEAERIAAEQAEAERIAAEQAAQATAQTQGSNNNFNTYDNASQQQTSSSYVLNTSTMKFHYPSCGDVKKIAPQNYSTYDGTRDSIIGQGYSPCGHCEP